MLKLTAALAALILSSTTLAQSEVSPAEAASAPASAVATAPPAKVEPVMGLMREKVNGSERPSDFCDTDKDKVASLPEDAAVLIVRKWPCRSRYGQPFNKELLQVLHAGKTMLVPSSSVFISPEDAKRLASQTESAAEANIEYWTLYSLALRRTELEGSLKEVADTAKHGLALVEANVYDVSEHTEGTGFRVRVHNSTKKTIKYVTFSVLGLNAVGDPVTDRLKGKNQTLRGIGPIEPDETSSYSKDYMWMTDIVNTHKLLSIKVEYMDGTSKLITNMKAVRLSTRTRGLLMDD